MTLTTFTLACHRTLRTLAVAWRPPGRRIASLPGLSDAIYPWAVVGRGVSAARRCWLSRWSN